VYFFNIIARYGGGGGVVVDGGGGGKRGQRSVSTNLVAKSGQLIKHVI